MALRGRLLCSRGGAWRAARLVARAVVATGGRPHRGGAATAGAAAAAACVGAARQPRASAAAAAARRVVLVLPLLLALIMMVVVVVPLLLLLLLLFVARLSPPARAAAAVGDGRPAGHARHRAPRGSLPAAERQLWRALPPAAVVLLLCLLRAQRLLRVLGGGTGVAQQCACLLRLRARGLCHLQAQLAARGAWEHRGRHQRHPGGPAGVLHGPARPDRARVGTAAGLPTTYYSH
ncbi:MAG: hypothetical protein J3K34DRAFT_445688 [Monoraphidium minutum]|nr:MAG: hypothetical protein J3K34DRAFT_445688 [Monoraphidium minutum]